MRRFLGFIAASGLYGVVSVLATTVLLVISIYEHLHEKNVTSYILVIVAALVFCIGAFIAWLRENEKYEKEKAKHDEPNFNLEIETILTLFVPQSNTTTICFAASLTNRGAPSHAGGWHVRYQSATIDVTVKYTSLPQERVEFGPIDDHKLVLKRQDLLPARTLLTLAAC